MKKNIDKICCILVVVVGVFDIIYGINHQVKQYSFKKNAMKTTANIYQTSNQENKQVLYVNYFVENKEYDGILILKDKKTDKSVITIYYDKNNPLNFTSGEINKSGIIIIIIGVIFTLLGSLSLVIYTLMKNTTNNKKNI